jgi:hypothetical protein
LISLGIFTPIAAFVASGEMAVANFKAHAPRGLWPILNRGELAALYCFVFLFIACQGNGRWSVHALWTRYFRYAAFLSIKPDSKANSVPQERHLPASSQRLGMRYSATARINQPAVSYYARTLRGISNVLFPLSRNLGTLLR